LTAIESQLDKFSRFQLQDELKRRPELINKLWWRALALEVTLSTTGWQLNESCIEEIVLDITLSIDDYVLFLALRDGKISSKIREIENNE